MRTARRGVDPATPSKERHVQTRHGTMTTDRPERYVKQLAGHWARKGSADTTDGTTVIRFETGQVVTLVPEDGLLRIEASVPDDGDPDRFAEVVADHLQRFGQRDELQVTWGA
jgi:hypothetical protein